MLPKNSFDVIIIGGSYSGLAAAMALGRALRKVLIIDDGKPCNIQTPYSHNFLTNDGKPPSEISAIARFEVFKYPTITFLNGLAINATENDSGFEIQVASGEKFMGKKIILATGIRDRLPGIEGIHSCWGISILHCPYCHGYEVKNENTGILGNGEAGFDLAKLISNWTNDLTFFTNGANELTAEQLAQLERHQIKVVIKEIKQFEHSNGYLKNIIFNDGTKSDVKVMYSTTSFEQHCEFLKSLGCELTAEGYIKIDAFQETTVKGVFACGDNSTRMRTVANAVAAGTATGIAVSKKIIFQNF
jgi:thioredoxin reductase